MAVVNAVDGVPRTDRYPRYVQDLLLALSITAFVFAGYAVAGFPTLSNLGSDNDSLLRLVQVRDLLRGQGWYDLHQYRMGPDGGFLMHWSRLVDAPLAGIILAASLLGVSESLAEAIALTLWPGLLMAASLFGLIRVARILGGDYTVFPAAVLCAGAIYFTGVFRPGAIDHHNAQIALTIAVLVFLADAPAHRWFSALAGFCAAAMLAIGMETAPYVAVAGAAVSLTFLIGGKDEANRAAAFGLSFAAGALVAFLLTVDPANWSVPACDAMSTVQLSLASLGGVGLAVAALSPPLRETFGRRLAVLAILGITVLGVAGIGFPQCLGDPYAGVDPRLREIWLDFVVEAQSIIALARFDWTKLLAYFLTPAIALVYFGILLFREGGNRPRLIYGGFLMAAFLVSCWQVRGSTFSIPLASVALAVGVGRIRESIASNATPSKSLALVAAWLLSFNIAWSGAAKALQSPSVGAVAGGTTVSADDCSANDSFGYLGGLPAGKVLAVSDLGAPILANTPHHVLAGPYHRNIAGNLAMIDAMLGSPDDVRRVVQVERVDYVVICRGNSENLNFQMREADGLMSRLLAGSAPAWLALDERTGGQPIEVYRVVHTGS